MIDLWAFPTQFLLLLIETFCGILIMFGPFMFAVTHRWPQWTIFVSEIWTFVVFLTVLDLLVE